MSTPLREKYDWTAVQTYLDKHLCRAKVRRRFRMPNHHFDMARDMGLLKMPYNWDTAKFANNPNHPSKGVKPKIIAALMLNPEQNWMELARTLGCSGPNVVIVAKELGITKSLDDRINWHEVQTVLDETLCVSETANTFGISAAPITKRMNMGVLRRPEGLNEPLPPRDPKTVFRNHARYGTKPFTPAIVKDMLMREGHGKACSCCGRNERADQPRSTLMVTYKNGKRHDQRRANIELVCVRCNEENMSVLEVVNATGTQVKFWKRVETHLGRKNTTIVRTADEFGISPKSIYHAIKKGRIKRPDTLVDGRSLRST